jgi:hypothetical protein
MSVRITCINKSGGNHADLHHAIEYLGWTNEESGKSGESSRLEVSDWIKNQTGKAFVRDDRGNIAFVGTREHSNGTKYLQTYSDEVWTENLLVLPECR